MALVVVLAACEQTGTPFVGLKARPDGVRANGQRTRIEITATTAAGKVGAGSVAVQANPGQAEPASVTLDAFGTAEAEAGCDATVDPRCGVADQFSVIATWTVDGKPVVASLAVTIDPPPPSAETLCNDTRDEDEDGLRDCADPDCESQPCSDLDACTENERCSRGACVGGTPVTCPASPFPLCSSGAGTCVPAKGCVYAPKNIGLSCDDGNRCTFTDKCSADGTCVGILVSCTQTVDPCREKQGTCNPSTGACRFDPARDGTPCGTIHSFVCCAGECTDISSSGSNCGGCAVACIKSSYCKDAALSGCEPGLAVSGRCSCTASAKDCPKNHTCNVDVGQCEPSFCQRYQTRQGVTPCLDYCIYPRP